MTLVLAITRRQSLWLLTDRRLSTGAGPVRDNATKTMIVETKDGFAILGYAGLGATGSGTEPSEWMSRLLHGRNLSLEQSLGTIADAMQKKLLSHLHFFPRGQVAAHHVVVPAFMGQTPKLYSIDLALAADRKKSLFRYTSHEWNYSQTAIRPPPVALAGSGGFVLQQMNRWKDWKRNLLRMIKASEQGRVPPRAVASYLAAISHEVHRADPLVGPNCVVTWRYNHGLVKYNAGSQSFSGLIPDASSPFIPTIVSGLDMAALAADVMAGMQQAFAQVGDDIFTGKFNMAELFLPAFTKLPKNPDDSLN